MASFAGNLSAVKSNTRPIVEYIETPPSNRKRLQKRAEMLYYLLPLLTFIFFQKIPSLYQ
jgi:hypothetical protein